jgi:ABC-2 type transport system permease protein
MRLYYEIALRSFRRATTYRAAYIAGMLTNAFFGAIRSFVYIALYQAGGVVANFTLADAISYTWVTQALISIGAGWISMDIASTIRSGDIVTDMSRPWSFYGYWFSRSIGEKLFSLLVRGSLTYAIGVFFFGAYVPNMEALLAFSISIGFALVISFAFGFMINMTAFWLVEITGVVLIANILLGFLSGFLLPLDFLPTWLGNLARVLPFQAISGLPAQIVLGQIDGTGLVFALLLQLFWSITMTGLALLVMRAAVHKVVIQGG